MKKTAIEMFNEIKDLDMPDGPEITVKDIVPFYCDKVQSELKFAETMKPKLERWLELLRTDGINSKAMVANDIQYILKEMKK